MSSASGTSLRRGLGRAAIVAVVSIALLAVAGMLVPRKSRVERTVTVTAPPGTVFALVNGTRTFVEWSAWAKSDPEATFEFTGPSFGVGATMRWRSRSPAVGNGEQRIVESVSPERVRSVVDLGRAGRAEIELRLAPDGDSTHVTWTCEQDRGGNPIDRLVGLRPGAGPCGRFARDLEHLRDVGANLRGSTMPAVGRWSDFRTHRFDASLSPEQRAAIERLESLSYVSGKTPAPDAPTIRVHDRGRSFDGLNFYTSGHAPEAALMDMDGRELHRWSHDFWSIWPDFPVGNELPATQFWRRAYLYANGDVLAIFDGLGLIKLDRSSRLLWALPCRAHHDLEVMPNGEIWVLTREAKIAPEIGSDVPVLEDFVSVVSPDGRELRRVSLLECVVRSPYAAQLRDRAARARFSLGANTLSVLDGRYAAIDPAFRAGNVLVSFLTIDTIAVADLERKTLVWMRTGRFMAQHDPKLLPGGHLLLFDNQGLGKESEVVELDPKSGKAVWQYRGTEKSPFFSETCGAAERLPNGNTLITESDGGRALEVTPDRDTVWEFYNPHRAGEGQRYIATLFEVVRLPSSFGSDWVQDAAPANGR